MGKEWGPMCWESKTTSEPNQVFTCTSTTKRSAENVRKERKRKANEEVKQNGRARKYARNGETIAARKAYNRHDGGVSPDDVDDDLSPQHLNN